MTMKLVSRRDFGKIAAARDYLNKVLA